LQFELNQKFFLHVIASRVNILITFKKQFQARMISADPTSDDTGIIPKFTLVLLFLVTEFLTDFNLSMI